MNDAGFTVRADFRAGWCTLTLSGGGQTVSIMATTLADFFGDLVASVADLAEGRRAVSCMWGAEPDGAFVDLARGAPERLGAVVVHDFGDPDWVDNARERWLPSRGAVRFDALPPLDELLRAFTAEFRRVRVCETDRADFMPAWGWLFPRRAFDRLEAAGVHFGYRPPSTAALEDGTP